MCPLVTASDDHTNVNLSSVELCRKHSSWLTRMMKAQAQRKSKIYGWSGVNQKEAQARDKRIFVFYFVLLLYLPEWLCLYRVLVIMSRSLRNTYSVLSFFFWTYACVTSLVWPDVWSTSWYLERIIKPLIPAVFCHPLKWAGIKLFDDTKIVVHTVIIAMSQLPKTILCLNFLINMENIVVKRTFSNTCCYVKQSND